MLVSSIGTGMTMVALSWIALTHARLINPGLLVSLSLVATVAPGFLGSEITSRVVKVLSGRGLVVADGLWRGSWWIVIMVWISVGTFNDWVYLALLAVASATAPWSRGGMQAVIAHLVPGDLRLEANSWIMAQSALASMIGPALGGLFAGVWGAESVLLVDGITYLVLAVVLLTAVPAPARQASKRVKSVGAWSTLRATPVLLPLLVMTFGMAAFFGLFEVGLPVHVDRALHSGPELLGAIWAVFGVGAFAGSFLSGFHRPFTIWQSAWGTCALWGSSLLIIGISSNMWGALIGILLAGLVQSPYAAVASTYMQNSVEQPLLPAVGTLWSAVLNSASPIGYFAGGFAIQYLSGSSVIVASAAGSILIGLFGLISSARAGQVGTAIPAPGVLASVNSQESAAR
jgi:predicted MFS family arabinose efflux permease